MTTITFKQDIKLSKNNFTDFSAFVQDFVDNNYPDSNIDNDYEVASSMKKNGLPDTFIKNFVKSY
ncbi:hypothetical protein EOM39_00935 [Candidatus Gracilibacteria bacterium]|nr:hypothetical protein [Candidatus Gracilibacteria bacterium]